MKLEFTKLVLENFKSFNGRHELTFTDFDYGLIYVKGSNKVEPRLGSNGAGKSSLWDAMTWCLYGKTASGLRNPDLKPWGGKGRTLVQLHVKIGKRNHVISRQIGPNKLELDGADCGPEDVVALTRLDFDLFINTVLLGQGRPLFFDLQPREKMQLFVNALQLDRWDARSETASERVAVLQQQAQELAADIQAEQSVIDELTSLVKAEQARAQLWDRDRADRVKDCSKQLRTWQKEMEAAEINRGNYDLALDAAETEGRHYRKLLVKHEDDLLAADRGVQGLEQQQQAVNDAIKLMRSELRVMGEGDKCPTCGQSLRGTAFAKHKAMVVRKIKAAEDDTGLTNSLKKARAKVAACEFAVKKVREAVLEYEIKATRARDELDRYANVVAQTGGKIDGLKASIKSLEYADNPHADQVRTLRKRAKSAQRKLEDCKADRVKVERRMARNKFWVKGFKEVRLYVLEELLQGLTLATDAMLQEAGLSGWTVRYDIEKETKSGSTQRGLQIMISSPRSQGEVKWEAWSGGEGQRLRVIGALALSEVLLQYAGVEPDLEILDEPTQHLSTRGVNDLCEYLADRATRLSRMIWYADHQSVESARFSSSVLIVREKAGSALALQG